MIVRVVVSLAFLLSALSLPAQDISPTGYPANGIFVGSNLDNVQISSGNLHIEIPISSSNGRGVPTSSKFVYDSKGWRLNLYCDDYGNCIDFAQPTVEHMPILALQDEFNTLFSYNVYISPCEVQPTTYIAVYRDLVIIEPNGTKHALYPNELADPPYGFPVQGCGSYQVGSTPLYATDGSGWKVDIASNWSSMTVYRRDGLKTIDNASYRAIEDTNGNRLLQMNGSGARTDTLGRTIPQNGGYYDSSGTVRTPQVTYTNVPYQTSLCQFQFSGAQYCVEEGGTLSVPQTITLPNGLSYSFSYVQNQYAEPSSVVLPTGGQISWTWQTGDKNGRYVSSRTVTAGSQSAVWNYFWPVSTPIATVRDPFGNDTVYGGVIMTGAPPSSIQSYSGTAQSGTLLKTISRDYFTNQTYADMFGLLLIRETTTLHATNQVSKVETDWLLETLPMQFGGYYIRISNGNKTAVREFDFGSGSAGSLLRTTTTSYLHTYSSAYKTKNIVDRPTYVSVTGVGPGALTNFTYDSYSLAGTSGAPNHDYVNFSSSNLLRGNVSLVQKYRNTDGGYLNTYFYHDDLGNLRSQTDSGGHSTTFSYNDNFITTGCIPGGANTQAFVTQVTNHLGHNFQTKYYPCNSLVHSSRDQNDINSGRQGTVVAYDYMNRPAYTSVPDPNNPYSNVQNKQFFYPDAVTVEVKGNQDGTNWTDTWTRFDGLGRQVQTAVAAPSPNNWIVTATCYDLLGRVSKKTYPKYSTGGFDSSPCTNLPGDTFTYDALSRPLTTTHPDGNYTYNEYAGNYSATYDETGRPRVFTNDALGRLTRVGEPHETTGATTYWTYNQYDVLGNLLCVEQRGSASSASVNCDDPTTTAFGGDWRVRKFKYDSLGQLLEARNPESGLTTYTYDIDGNVATKTAPKPNQTGSLTVTMTYTYDGLHRMSGKSYSSGGPSWTYLYDAGGSSTNVIGRLRLATDYATVAKEFSYDAMGRMIWDSECLPSNCGSGTYFTNASYNLDGSMAWLKYPSGRKVTFGYDTAGRLQRGDFADFNGTPVNYNYFYSYFFADGQINAAYHPNGVVDWLSLNSRQQPSYLQVTNGSTTLINREYNYTSTATSPCQTAANNTNNGNVMFVRDLLWNSTHNGDEARSQYFSYDCLNRIRTSDEGPTAGVGRWGQSYTTDAWGNLNQITTTKGSASQLSVAINNNNRFNGYGYDAAGNMTMDVGHTYIYDAESRVTGIDSNATTYTYDAIGMRIRKQTGNDWTEYIYFGSNVIAEKKPGASLYSAALTQSGLTAFYPNYVADASVGNGAWHTDSASAGAWLKADFGSATTVTSTRVYANTAGYGGSYSVQYSDDSSSWTTAGSISPNQIGWNAASWSHSQPHRYWRLYLTNTPGSGAWLNELQLLPGGSWTDYIYAGGKRVAMAAATPSPGVTEFYHSDHLGSTRLMTNAQGSIVPGSEGTVLPYGEEYSPTATTNHYKFTGKERDTETTNDYFGARYYGSTMGRFLSVDPSSMSIDKGNPQSWNRYNYTLNNPLNMVDTNGKWPTYAHNMFIELAFAGASQHQVKLLQQASKYIDGKKESGQKPEMSYRHSMCAPGQNLTSCAGMIQGFVTGQINASKTLKSQGQEDKSVTQLGYALHTLGDMGSPEHVTMDGTPRVWNGGFDPDGLAPGAAHIFGESATINWYDFGQTIRNYQAGAIEAGRGDWVTLSASEIVERMVAARYANVRRPVEEEQARQCALGNRAACK